MPDSADRGRPFDPELGTQGFQLAGVLAIERYAALVSAPWSPAALLPSARSAIVLGCGGRALAQALERAPEAQGPDPFDRFTRRVGLAAAERLRVEGFATTLHTYAERREGVFADFVALARAAGLGVPSRLGILLHPEFGPWVSFRALLLTEKSLPDAAPLEWAPCEGCPAPCVAACHGTAVRDGPFDGTACGRARVALPACADRCDSRRACVVGPEHAYPAAAEAHHMRAALGFLDPAGGAGPGLAKPVASR